MGERVFAVPRGTLGSLAWIARHPSSVYEHREYFLQRLRILLRRPPRLIPATGSPVWRLPPWFVAAHGQPLNSPRVVAAAEASEMRDDDVVLGLALGGRARAYPWWIMDDHHLANDIVGGRPVTVVLCEACSTGIAFDPVLEGRTLLFDHRHSFNGTVAIEDRETGSLWSPYLMGAVRGPLEGATLDPLPLVQLQWGEWRARHPDTDVLAPELGDRHGHGSEHRFGEGGIPGLLGDYLARRDDRLPPSTPVLGVVVPGHEVVYPLATLGEAHGVVNDDLGGRPVVILAAVGTPVPAALAFSRNVEGEVLTFEPTLGGAIDRETGSTWNVEGLAVAGPLASRRLEFVPSHVSEWFVWPAHFPDIRIGSAGP